MFTFVFACSKLVKSAVNEARDRGDIVAHKEAIQTFNIMNYGNGSLLFVTSPTSYHTRSYTLQYLSLITHNVLPSV